MAQAAQLLVLVRLRAVASSGEARRIREAARLSISELANACGVDQSTIWRWEHGHRSPRGERGLAYGQLIETLRKETGLTRNDDEAEVAPSAPPVEHIHETA